MTYTSVPSTGGDWGTREEVTAYGMNSCVRDVHKFLVNPPSCRLSVKQNGSSSAWLTATNGWNTFTFSKPGSGADPSNEYDTSGGQMVKADANGVVKGITAPLDGIYVVTFYGMMYTQSASPNNNCRMGKNITTDANWTNSYGPVGAMSPVKTQLTTANQYICALTVHVPFWAGQTVSVGAAGANKQYLGDSTSKGFISMRWVGGDVSDYYANN